MVQKSRLQKICARDGENDPQISEKFDGHITFLKNSNEYKFDGHVTFLKDSNGVPLPNWINLLLSTVTRPLILFSNYFKYNQTCHIVWPALSAQHLR